MKENNENIDKSGVNDAYNAAEAQTPRTINSLAMPGDELLNACGLGTFEDAAKLAVGPTVGPMYTFDRENHIHLLDGRPLHGTSTVVGTTDSKPGLIWWGAELAAVVCLESGQHIPTIRAEYDQICELTGKAKTAARDKLQRKYPIFKAARYAHRERKESTAAEGTDAHARRESYIKSCIYDNNGEPLPEPFDTFSDWALANVEEFLWSEAHCYSHTLWTGGICDFGMILNTSELAIGDFKRSKDIYDSHVIQTAGYALQIEENGLFTAQGATVSPGIEYIRAAALVVFPSWGDKEPLVVKNVSECKQAFRDAVGLHKFREEFQSQV